MKITLLQERLKEGLTALERVSSKPSFTLPILNNILLKTIKNFVCMESTNLEIGLRWWILAKIEGEGKITLPSRLFSSFINLLTNDKLELEVDAVNLRIRQKNLSTEIRGVSADDFPIIPQMENGEIATVNGRSFCEGLNQVINIPTPSTSRPEISGIYLSFKKNEITLAATDSFRLGEKKSNIDNSLSKEYSFILPQRTAREIVNIFGERDEDLKIRISPNHIMIESQMKEVSHPQTQLISKLIEGEYPNYKEIIPQKFETQIFLKRNEFIEQIKLASLFTKKTSEIKLKADLSGQKMEIISQNPDIGEYRSTLQGEVKGAVVELSFNYRFLLDGLLGIKSPDVVLGLNGADGAGVLSSSKGDDYIYVVMPMRGN